MRPSPVKSIIAKRDAFVAGRDINVLLKTDQSDLLSYHEDWRARPVFIQYLNPEVLACYGKDIARNDNTWLLERAIHTTRLAVLSTESYLIVPASYIFEVPNFMLFLRALAPLVSQGIFCYTGPYVDLDVYRDSKIVEYRKDHSNPYISSKLTPKDWRTLVWTPRYSRSTAIDIGDRWRTALDSGGPLYTVRQQLHHRWSGRHAVFENMILDIPNRLEGQAFISRFVRGTIPVEFKPTENTQLNFFLSQAYLESYLLDLNATLLVDLPGDDLSCGLHTVNPKFSDRLVSARHLDIILTYAQIFHYVHEVADWDELLALRSEPGFGLLALHAVKSVNINPVRVAAVRTRRQGKLRPAGSILSAIDNIQYMAENLITLESEIY